VFYFCSGNVRLWVKFLPDVTVPMLPQDANEKPMGCQFLRPDIIWAGIAVCDRRVDLEGVPPG
jgi:hypothetical protein